MMNSFVKLAFNHVVKGNGLGFGRTSQALGLGRLARHSFSGPCTNWQAQVMHGSVIKQGLEHNEPAIRKLMDLYYKVDQDEVAGAIFQHLLSAHPPERQLMIKYHWCFDYATADINGMEIVKGLHAEMMELGLGNNDRHAGMVMSLYNRVANRPELAVEFFSTLRSPGYAAWRNLIWAYAAYDPKKAIAAFGDMEKTHIKPNLDSFRALLYAHAQAETKNEDALKDLIKMKQQYNLQPQIEHIGCYIDKLVKTGFIAEAIKLAAEIEIPLSNHICGMIFGECAKSLPADKGSANKMIEVLLAKGGNYVVDYPVYHRLSDQGVEFPPCVKCGEEHYRENKSDRRSAWSVIKY